LSLPHANPMKISPKNGRARLMTSIIGGLPGCHHPLRRLGAAFALL
jgi:hypothetical protein